MKLLFAIPAVWLFVILVFGSNSPAPEYVRPDDTLQHNRVNQPPLHQPQRRPLQGRENNLVASNSAGEAVKDPSVKEVERHEKQKIGEGIIANPIDIDGPGENGAAVKIVCTDLKDPLEKQKCDKGFQSNAFNQYASDKISLHRSLPDVRPTE